MLARYDTERKAFNLGPVQELKNYTVPIPEGYNANLANFSHRKPNVAMHDIPLGPGVNYRVSDHDQRRQRLLAAAESGKLQKGAATDSRHSGVAQFDCRVDHRIGGQREWVRSTQLLRIASQLRTRAHRRSSRCCRAVPAESGCNESDLNSRARSSLLPLAQAR
jgi:hypothetical protein